MKEYNENQIDAYLLGQMQQEELQAFKDQLLMDKELVQRVEDRKQLLRYVDVIGDVALKERIRNVHQNAKKNLPDNRSFKIVSLLKYAAAIVLLITTSYFLIRSFSSEQDIYGIYYQAYELSFGTREGSTSEDEVLALAGRLYSDGEYSQAIKQFLALPDSLNSAKITLAKGISYLETGQYSNAIQTLQILIDAKDPIYEGHARWYQAMTFLKDSDDLKAKALLQQIVATPNGFKQKEAKEILDLIK